MSDKKTISAAVTNPLELWKAIHGGCWPGPPVDLRLTTAVNEVLSGLALHNLAHAFEDQAVAANLKRVATDSLSKSLPALQKTVIG